MYVIYVKAMSERMGRNGMKSIKIKLNILINKEFVPVKQSLCHVI